jgi:hypothetical protein
MATHNVLIQKSVAAMNVDAWNRSAVGGGDLDNGNVVVLASKSATAGEPEVWTATQPATATLNAGLWMVYSPEIVLTTQGTKSYKNINPDPQDFFVPQGVIFDAFKLQVGDLLLMTADGLAGTKSTNGFVVATNASYKLTWGAAAISGLSLRYLGDEYVSIGSGNIDSQRVTAYAFEVVALA